MLWIRISRGWISSSDVGINESYYLYSEVTYRMISPYGSYDVVFIGIRIYYDGTISGSPVNSDGGVLYPIIFTFNLELCYFN